MDSILADRSRDNKITIFDQAEVSSSTLMTCFQLYSPTVLSTLIEAALRGLSMQETKRREHKCWSVEHKSLICAEARVAGAAISQISKRLDVQPSTIFGWFNSSKLCVSFDKVASATRLLLCLTFGWLASSLAMSQTADITPERLSNVSDSSVVEYFPDDFARFAPQNALNLVSRIPGFVIRDLETFQRGVSGATGNVLIDGRVIKSKSGSIFSRLAELPADKVERIDVSRASGGASGRVGELVANVVLVQTIRPSGTADISASGATDGSAGASIGLSAQYNPTGKTQLLWTGRYSRNRSRFATVFETIDDFEMTSSSDRGGGVSNATSVRAEVISSLHENLQFNGSAFWALTDDENESTFATDASEEVFISAGGSKEWEVNGSFDYGPSEAPSNTLTFVAKKTTNNNSTDSQLDADEASGSLLNSLDSTEELVVFYQNSTSILGKTFKSEVEWAQTRFTSSTELESSGLTITDVDAFLEDVAAKESRLTGQIRTNVFSKGGMSLDAGLGGEFSRIFAGGERLRSLGFIKPYIGYQHQYQNLGEISLSAERTVSQLSLASFATSIDLVRGLVDAGNAELNPERQWVFTSSYRKIFGETGSVDLIWTQELIDGIVEFIELPDGTSGFGNAGSARRSNVSLSVVYPFSRGPLKDATASFSANYTGSSIVDPITMERRALSDTPQFSFDASFDKQFEKYPVNASVAVSWSDGFSSLRGADFQEFPSTVSLSGDLQWSFGENYQLSASAFGQIPGSDRETFTSFGDNGSPFFVQTVETRIPYGFSISLSRTF